MAGSNTAVFGIYASRAAAEHGADALISAGFRQADISVLMADVQSTREFAHERNTKAPEGATTGAVAGGAIGGTLGWLAGIGALAIPGVGPRGLSDSSPMISRGSDANSRAAENIFEKVAKLHEFVELGRFAKIAVRAESFHEFPVALRVRG